MRAGIYGRQSRGKTKSIDEQLHAGETAVSGQGWALVGKYSDGTSASRYGTKKRDEWVRVLKDIEDGCMDVLVLWESDRGDRTLETWGGFLTLLQRTGTKLFVIAHDRLYDPRNHRDWKSLAEDGVDNAYFSEKLSVNTRRGHAGAAAAGLPPGGPIPLGYKRKFDPETGKRLGQEPKEPEATLVRRIFRELADGQPVMAIAERRGVDRATVRRVAKNRAYVGLRVHNGTEHPGTWEPLVDMPLFLAANRYLDDPSRVTHRHSRPGRQTHLLSYLGVCDPCGSWMNFSNNAYRCRLKGCVSIPNEELDDVVSEIVRARLKKPDAIAALLQRDEDEAARAQAQVETLTAQLNTWRMSAALGNTTPESLAVIERELLTRISEQTELARTAGLPEILKPYLEAPELVDQRWNEATLIARRQVVKSLCEIRVGRGIPGRSSKIQKRERALKRLSMSRWVGDELTWGERLGMAG
jgi:site-specific DNA recombinase